MKKKGPAPPSLAAWILSKITRGGDRLSILSDFSEIYEELAAEDGSFKARKWYWTQVLRSIPLFVLNHLCKENLANIMNFPYLFDTIHCESK